MNCPKCNASLNEGDKFCQTCGNLITQEPKINENPEVVNQPQPVVTNQPANQMPPQQPIPNMNPNPINNVSTNTIQPENYNQQPMNNSAPVEVKKNNTVVYVLLAFIVILLAVVVFLIAGPYLKDEAKDTNKEDNKTVEEEKEDDKDEDEVIASSYIKTNVNEYTFELPEGYSAGFYNDTVMFYDDNMTDVEGYIYATNMAYSGIDKEQTKVNLTSIGINNISYTEKKINDKNMLVYSGEYEGYDVDVIYVQYSYTKVIGAEIYYKSENDVRDNVYNILGRIKVDDSAFSSNTNIRIPNLDIFSGMGL